MPVAMPVYKCIALEMVLMISSNGVEEEELDDIYLAQKQCTVTNNTVTTCSR